MENYTYNKKFYQEYGYKVTDEAMGNVLDSQEQKNAYERSYNLAHSGKIKGANTIQKYIDKYPDTPAFKNHLASLYLSNNKNIEAKKIQLDIINSHPDYLFGKISLAEQYLREDDLDMARKMLGEPRKIETISPNEEIYHCSEFLTYYCLAGWYEVEIEDRDAAEKHLALMIEVDPDDFKTKFLAKKIIDMSFAHTMKKMQDWKDVMISVDSFPTYIVEQTEIPPTLIHKELEAFYEYSDENLPEKIITNIMQLPRETLIADLERIVEDSFRRYDYFVRKYGKDYMQSEQSFMVHAVRFLSVLDAKESLPTVLNMFRQGEEFSEFWFSDYFSELFDRPLVLLGKDRLDMLKSYTLEANQFHWVRSAVIGAMAQIALHYPEKREEAIRCFKEIYDYMLQNPDDKGLIDSEFISFSLPHVVELRDNSFAEYVEKFDEKQWIYDTVMGNAEKIISELNQPPEAADIHPMPYDIYEFYNRKYLQRAVPHNSTKELEGIFDTKVAQYLQNTMTENMLGKFGQDTDLGNEYDNDEYSNGTHYQDPVVRDSPKVGRNDPCPCGSGKKHKRCCLNK